jgi:hypothetical protein
VGALNELGGLMEREEEAGRFPICGYSCLLADVTETHRELGGLMAALVSEWVGVPVQDRCERSKAVWCWLEVHAA